MPATSSGVPWRPNGTVSRAGAGHLRDKACQSGFVGSDGQDIYALRDQALGDGGAKVACGASNDDILA